MRDSKIQWCDHTFNPWEGCTKVSPGCANCYAEARNKRWNKGANWGPGAPRRRTSAANWKQPIRWNEHGWICKCGKAFTGPAGRYTVPFYEKMHRARVFCASLADWLDDEVPIEWLSDLLKLIHDTPNLDWLLLTKRPGNFDTRIRAARNWLTLQDFDVAEWLNTWLNKPEVSGPQRGRQKLCERPAEAGKPPANVWIGATVENQAMADKRIPELLKIPAKVLFLSCEPLLEKIFLPSLGFTGPQTCVDWVIIGGESGPGARPFNIDWARDLVKQCRAASVAPFVKQMGSNAVIANDSDDECWPGATIPICDDYEPSYQEELAPLHFADQKGGDWSEWPEDLRVREFPAMPKSALQVAVRKHYD